jgi:nucleotidyltransferase substrate binding protein (TIGR01987 family)
LTDPELFEQFRNSVIQTFAYSFELAFKLLWRTLEAQAASDQEIEGLSFNEIIRLAARSGYIASPDPWFAFRTARNKTSHGYEESFAQEAYLSAQAFLPEGKQLLQRLKGRLPS